MSCPGASEFEHEGRMVSGYWSRVSNRVVLAEKAMMDGALVRHEMLHALEHDIGHSRRAYLQRCGGVVVCITSCLREAGSAPLPGAWLARVPPDSMLIDVQVNPLEPGSATDGGNFRLTVTVRNPRRDSVVVLLPSSGDGAPPESFSFVLKSDLLGLWYEERAWDPGHHDLRPGRDASRDLRLHGGVAVQRLSRRSAWIVRCAGRVRARKKRREALLSSVMCDG
jgi:hypothetical protein